MFDGLLHAVRLGVEQGFGGQRPTRADFVRSMPTATAIEVVRAGRAHGFRLTRKYVNDLRSSDRGHEAVGRGPKPGGQRKGFAAMDPEKARRISALGGKAAHRYGVAHEFTHSEAVRIGRIGGSR